MIHIITDTHFGHDTLKIFGLRPNDFEEKIIRNWQEKVGVGDTVIHLGDFGFDKDDENVKRITSLPGKKILLRGNHDKNSLEYYMNNGFDFCCDELTMTAADIKILFTHRPRYDHSYDINIHGHHHNIHYPPVDKLFLPIALEVMGYAPISMDEKFLRKLSRLVERYWLCGKFPTPIEIKSFGSEPLCVLRDVDIFDKVIGNKHEQLRFNRTFFELYSQTEGFDTYALRNICLQAKKDFIHSRISLQEFKEKMEAIKNSTKTRRVP